MRLLMEIGFQLFLIGLVALGLSCRGSQAPEEDAADALAADATDPDTLATLERTMCFGTCPSYKLAVYTDGTVEYQGRDYVAVEGRDSTEISQEALQQLVEAFQEADYFSFRNNYVSGEICREYMTDLPTAITSFRYEGREKKVTHYHGCRGFEGQQRLTALEDTIDQIVGSERWVEGSEAEADSTNR